MSNRTLIALTGIGALLAAAPALAGEPETSTRHVNYADLNLASVAGVAALRHRITAAIDTVCNVRPGHVVMLSEQLAVDRCRAQTRAEVDRRVAALVSQSPQLATR